MKKVFYLIKKDFIVDWRQQNALAGVLLYVLSMIVSIYMTLKQVIDFEIWSGLYWIILLFIAVNAISKSFLQEEKRDYYYFNTIAPSLLILSKLIYSFIYFLTLCLLSLLIFILFFDLRGTFNYLFLINLILGSLGLSSAFTLVSAISMRTSNRSIMMAVLGFPVVIPVMILAVSNTIRILDGYIWVQIKGNVLTLLSIDVLIVALALLLFPIIWKA